MKDSSQYLITVRFPSWSYGKDADGKEDLSKTEHRGSDKDEYQAFGVQYLIEVPIGVTLYTEDELVTPKMIYSSEAMVEHKVAKHFIEKMVALHGTFDGEILFVEEKHFVIL